MNFKIPRIALNIIVQDALGTIGIRIKKCLNRPYLVTFAITNFCNARCDFCECWKNHDYSGELNAQEWINLLGELHHWLKLCSIVFTGSNWTWYASEFDGIDTFFGLVIGHETKLGYFSLQELKECCNGLGLGIERDIWFEPCTIKELKTALRANTTCKRLP